MIIVEKYDKKNIKAAIEIWNEVVRDGVAFPQEDELDEISGDKFFSAQSFTGLAWRCIFFTQIMLDVADTFQMQVTPLNLICADVILVNLSSSIRLKLRGNLDLEFCSLTR